MTSFASGIQRNFAFLPGCGVSPTSSGCSGRLSEPKTVLASITGEGDGAADALSIDEGGAVDGVCDGEGEAEDDSLLQGGFPQCPSSQLR
jgi:hypothetical protein